MVIECIFLWHLSDLSLVFNTDTDLSVLIRELEITFILSLK